LIPAFEKFSKYQAKVEVIAVGTGKAIRLAKKGEADVLFVHDPFREEKFVAEGYGVNRREVMYNEFAIVGPAKDPAKVKKARTVIEAFEEIAETGSLFVSRGDDSGTNIREMDLWDDAGLTSQRKKLVSGSRGQYGRHPDCGGSSGGLHLDRYGDFFEI
jgi:tungstate transport system substrate-binding protein